MRDVLGLRLPTRDEVSAAAGRFEDARARPMLRRWYTGPHCGWLNCGHRSCASIRGGLSRAAQVGREVEDQDEAITWRIGVAPGLVRVSTRKAGTAAQSVADQQRERAEQAWAEHDAQVEQLEFSEGTGISARLNAPERAASKQEITEWSAKSRAAMVGRLATLDFAPMYADAGRPPAMVTLTLPGDWLTVAPTGKHFKRAVRRWLEAYRRAWGERLTGVWKLEFQGRGAPHLHILMCPPVSVTSRGERFRDWLSRSWSDAVAHPDPDERRRHLLAGTGVDYAEGCRATDPKRIAVYFTKHAAPGGSANKEYQHRVPEPWQQPGAGPGRFWGYWGLDVLEVTVEVSPGDAIAAARIIRRHHRAQRRTRRVRVWRPRFDPDSGQLRGNPWRHSTVRVHRLRAGRGYVCVSAGPRFAEQLARAIQSRRSPAEFPNPANQRLP